MRRRTFKVGRDASSGRFISVIEADEYPATTTVETITVRMPRCWPAGARKRRHRGVKSGKKR